MTLNFAQELKYELHRPAPPRHHGCRALNASHQFRQALLHKSAIGQGIPNPK